MPEIHSQPPGLSDIISSGKRIAHDAPRPVSGTPRNADPAQSSSDELLFVSDSTIWRSSGTRLAHTAPRIETGTPRNAGSEYSISQNHSKQVQRMPESTILMSAERGIEDAMPRIASDAPRNAEPGYRITQNPSYQVLEGPDSTILMGTDRRFADTTPRIGKGAPRNADFKEGLQVVDAAEGESGPSGFATRTRAKSVLKSGNWTREERDMLLEWLGRNLGNYEGFKMHVKSTCSKIAVEVFGGSRTAEGIRGQWDLMKKKYQKAKQRLNSTGEGQREGDSEKWTSIKLGWLDNICPNYEQIDDILKRDRAVTPLFVAETGGISGPIQFVNGVRQKKSADSQWEAEDFAQRPVPLEFSDEEDENDVHPPAGGQKTPLSSQSNTGGTTMENSIRKGESKGTGLRALKRKRQTTVENAIESIAEKRMMFERTRFEYEKERDEKNFRSMELREQNRHEEAMARWKLMEKKFESQAKRPE